MTLLAVMYIKLWYTYRCTFHPPPPHQQVQDWVGPSAKHGPSESDEVTTEDDVPTHPISVSTTDAYDYVELVGSATSLSTPASTENQPFASEDLGETVIHFDKAKTMAKQSNVGASPELKPPSMSPGFVGTEEGEDDGEDKASLEKSLIAEYQAMVRGRHN